jgi:surface protein
MNVSFTNNSSTATHNIPVKKYFTHDLVKRLENSVDVSLDFQTEYLNDRIVFSDGTTITGLDAARFTATSYNLTTSNFIAIVNTGYAKPELRYDIDNTIHLKETIAVNQIISYEFAVGQKEIVFDISLAAFDTTSTINYVVERLSGLVFENTDGNTLTGSFTQGSVGTNILRQTTENLREGSYRIKLTNNGSSEVAYDIRVLKEEDFGGISISQVSSIVPTSSITKTNGEVKIAPTLTPEDKIILTGKTDTPVKEKRQRREGIVSTIFNVYSTLVSDASSVKIDASAVYSNFADAGRTLTNVNLLSSGQSGSSTSEIKNTNPELFFNADTIGNDESFYTLMRGISDTFVLETKNGKYIRVTRIADSTSGIGRYEVIKYNDAGTTVLSTDIREEGYEDFHDDLIFIIGSIEGMSGDYANDDTETGVKPYQLSFNENNEITMQNSIAGSNGQEPGDIDLVSFVIDPDYRMIQFVLTEVVLSPGSSNSETLELTFTNTTTTTAYTTTVVINTDLSTNVLVNMPAYYLYSGTYTLKVTAPDAQPSLSYKFVGYQFHEDHVVLEVPKSLVSEPFNAPIINRYNSFVNNGIVQHEGPNGTGTVFVVNYSLAVQVNDYDGFRISNLTDGGFNYDLSYSGANSAGVVVQHYGVVPFSNTGSQYEGFIGRIAVKDAPTLRPVLKNCFKDAVPLKYGYLDEWDVSQVVNMEGMFYGATTFNEDITGWNTGNVTNMDSIFRDAPAFNQDISVWNISNVTKMGHMFENAVLFDKNIGNWNVSTVQEMQYMFDGDMSFNVDISSWNTANATNMRNMFNNAHTFNQDIGGWDISNVTDIQYMFNNAHAFNQDLSNWRTPNVTNMRNLFNNVLIVNQDLSAWVTDNVTNMAYMFNHDNSNNDNLFNSNISGWNTEKVTDMAFMLIMHIRLTKT